MLCVSHDADIPVTAFDAHTVSEKPAMPEDIVAFDQGPIAGRVGRDIHSDAAFGQRPRRNKKSEVRKYTWPSTKAEVA
jgi:hypothetical protein